MIRTARFALSTLILTAATLLASPPSTPAAPIAYALAIDPDPVHFSDLYTIDLGTAVAQRVGSTGRHVGGLAIAPDGTLYAVGLFSTLYRLDAMTGIATSIAETPHIELEQLDFAGNTLLAADLVPGSTTVYAIDTTTAATTLLATTTPGRGGSYGFAATRTGSAFLAVTDTDRFPDDPIPTTLSTIDLTTGATTDIGPIVGHPYLRGIDTDAAGTLYGLDVLGSLFTIDQATGAPTPVGDTGVQDWIDLAIDPPVGTAAVPEPGSAVLLAIGLVAVGTWGKVRLVRPRPGH